MNTAPENTPLEQEVSTLSLQRQAERALEQKEFDQAITCYEAVIKQFPEQEKPAREAIVSILQMLLGKGRREVAKPLIAHAQALLDKEPENIQYLCILGNTYTFILDFHNALDCLKKAQTLNPKDTNILSLLGITYFRAQDAEKATEYFEEALQLSPEDIHLYVNYSNVLIGKKEFPKALELVNNALEVKADFVSALLQKATILERMNQTEEALAVLSKIDATQQNNPNYFVLLAKLERRQGRIEHALTSIDQAIKTAGTPLAQATFMNEKAKMLDKKGDYAAAFELFTKAQYGIGAITQYSKADKAGVARAIITASNNWISSTDPTKWEMPVKEPAQPNHILLMGFPRSGTTLMEQILSTADNIAATDEIAFIATLITELLKTSPGQTYPQVLESLSEEHLARLRQQYFTLASTALKQDVTKCCLLDKMPLNMTYLGFIKLLFPHAPIITMIRDPRDVVLSCFMQNFTPSNAMANFYDLHTAATFYTQVMDLYLTSKQYIPLNMIEIRYEDLVKDTEANVKNLFNFLSLPWDENVLHYHNANKERLVTTPSYEAVTKPIYRDAMARWKHYETQLKPIMPILEPYIKIFGYE